MSGESVVRNARLALDYLNGTLQGSEPDWISEMVEKCNAANEPWRMTFVKWVLSDILVTWKIPDEPIRVSDQSKETLLSWLASSPERTDFVDQAIKRYGLQDTFVKNIEYGLKEEVRYVANIVRRSIRALESDEDVTERLYKEYAQEALDFLLDRQKSNRPDWFYSMIAEARIGQDKWRRDFAKMALEQIVSMGDVSGPVLEVAGESATTLAEWLSADANIRVQYIDATLAKHGHQDTFLRMLDRGYEKEADEVAAIIRRHIRDVVEGYADE